MQLLPFFNALGRPPNNFCHCDAKYKLLTPLILFLKVLKTNLKNLGIDSFVYEGDFKQLLKKQPPEKFDFIYIDPPYAGDHAQTALEMIAEKKLLKKDGVAIVEKLTEDKREFSAPGLEISQNRKMGNVTMVFYVREDNE